MRTVSVIAFILLVFFASGGRMNTSAGRTGGEAQAVIAGESIAQSAAPATADVSQDHSSGHPEVRPGRWLSQFEPLLLLLLGSVLLAVSTGIRLVLARR